MSHKQQRPIDETEGGTGQISYAAGDILYALDTNELGKLAIGDDGETIIAQSGIPKYRNRFERVGVYGIGLHIDSGTLTIRRSDGTNLSPENPAFVTINSTSNPGELVTHKITQNYSIHESDLDGMTWETTAGRAWNFPMPIFVWFVSKEDDSDVIPCLGRLWSRYGSLGGRVGFISSDPLDMTDIRRFLSLDDTITGSDYVTTNLIRAGYFTMQKNSDDEWEFDALNRNQGADTFPGNFRFRYAKGHNGAFENSHFSSTNGGDTMPDPSGGTIYFYNLLPGGEVLYQYSTNAGTSAGSGSGRMIIHVPFKLGLNLPARNNGNFSISNPANHSSFQTYSVNYQEDTEQTSLSLTESFNQNGDYLTPGDIIEFNTLFFYYFHSVQ